MPTPAPSTAKASYNTDLPTHAAQAAALLKALAHPDRLLLLCQLVQAEHSVAQLSANTGMTQPNLSQQLGVLRAEGLVSTRRDGKFMHYRIAHEGVQAVLQALYQHYCAPDSASAKTSPVGMDDHIQAKRAKPATPHSSDADADAE